MNNKRIHILRGTSEKVAELASAETLAAGQPFYITDKNYLTIGSLNNGAEQSINQLPITVREINGWYDDNDKITAGKDNNYRVGPTLNGALELNAKNSIEFTVRQSAAEGEVITGGASFGTPLIIEPKTLTVDGTIMMDTGALTMTNNVMWRQSLRIDDTNIRSVKYTDEDLIGSDITINDLGGNINIGGNILPINSSIKLGNEQHKFWSLYVDNVLTYYSTAQSASIKGFLSLTAHEKVSDNMTAEGNLKAANISFHQYDNYKNVILMDEPLLVQGNITAENSTIYASSIGDSDTKVSAAYFTSSTIGTLTNTTLKSETIDATTLNVHTINLITT